MPRNRLPRVMKHYSPAGRRNHGRPLKRLLDTWDWNGSTSGPTPWHIWRWWLLLHVTAWSPSSGSVVKSCSSEIVIAVCFNYIGVSFLKMETTPKHVGAN